MKPVQGTLKETGRNRFFLDVSAPVRLPAELLSLFHDKESNNTKM
jgi:hypothetical protein